MITSRYLPLQNEISRLSQSISSDKWEKLKNAALEQSMSMFFSFMYENEFQKFILNWQFRVFRKIRVNLVAVILYNQNCWSQANSEVEETI